MRKLILRIGLPFVLGLLGLLGYHLWSSGQSATLQPAPPQIDARFLVETGPTKEPFVWWEAEKTAADNFPPPKLGPFAANNPAETELLSDGQWISVDGKHSSVLFLEYTVTIPQAGDYFFYTRKFWQHGSFRWRWDDGAWQSVGERYLMDNVTLRPTVAVNWIGLGQVALSQSTHHLRIELTENEGPAAFDCFVLTKTPLQPRGSLQPNQRYRTKLADWAVFDPERDGFQPSAIDLRSLNEAFAGENGFIQAKGESFVQSKTGKPVRFWAVNSDPSVLQMDPPTMAYMARFLAKRGVNMVRLHGRLFDEKDIRTIPPETIQRLFAFVSAMKREGIYTGLSIYFPMFMDLKASMGFAGYDGQHPYSLLFFNEAFQTIYRGWWRSLLTAVNPATGTTLANDPAVAMVELVNEDSYFFWTFDPYKGLPTAQTVQLETQFGTWLTRKYGSVDKAIAQWQTSANSPQPIQPDQPQARRAAFVPLAALWENRDTARSQDTAAFLADSQKQFFERSMQFLHQDLGYSGLIYGSNWIAANAQILGPLDKYTNTVGDFMDHHGYVDPFHTGKAASYSVGIGDQYRDRAALRFQAAEKGEDFNLPIMDLRYNGKPSTLTEFNWTQPNRFRAEAPLVAAAYGALQGTDGLFWFFTSEQAWETTLDKFPVATPAILGQFPAAALIYRQGLLAEGQDVVNVDLKISDVYQLRGAPLTAPQNLDALRQKDVRSRDSAAPATVDPLAFLVGKVNLHFSKAGGAFTQSNLSELINRSAKTVRSTTGQLNWNYAQGLVTVNAPGVQGVTGFLNPSGSSQPATLKLPDLQIQTNLDYGTMLLVALDQKPIAQSQRLLLQVMSEEQNLGWRTAGYPLQTIEQVGNPPLMVRKLAGQVKLQRPDAASLRVTALDFNGYPVKTVSNATQIDLLADTLYYLIEKS